MERLALAALAGTLAGLWLPVPGEYLLPVTAVLLLLARLRGGCYSIVACLLAAWCWAALQAGAYRAALPGIELHTADRLLTGCVVSFPRHGVNGSSFLFRGRAADAGSGLMYLRTYPQRSPDSSAEPFVPRAAHCYQLHVRLKPPHGQSNPAQFDRQHWFMAGRVQATGYVRDSRLNLRRGDLHVDAVMLTARLAVRDRIRAALGEHAATAVIEGLTVGVRSAISQELWEVFRATGTVHLMAISGLHVGLVAGAVWWLAGLLCGRLAPPGRLRWPALAAGGCAALGYALLAGWSAPTQRAALMFVVLLAVTMRYRRPRPLGLLAASVPAVVFADPFVVLGAGFWMSYLAVATLLTAAGASPESLQTAAPSGWRSRLAAAAGNLLRAQWRLTLGLAVPNMLLFDAWLVLGPVVNLIAIPLFSLFLLPLTLVSVMLLWLLPAPGAALLGLVAEVLAGALELLRTAADSGWARFDANGRQLSLQLWAGSLSLLLLLPRPLRSPPMLTALPALCAVVGLLLPQPAFQVDVMDVGQGTAVVIRAGERTLLVDTGPAWPGGDAARTVLLPFLRQAGVGKLDVVVVSHADTDHSGGLAALLDVYPSALVLLPAPDAGSEHARCRRGMQWRWGDAEVQILHPAKLAGWSENDASCVVSVRFRDVHVLLPGDIETAAEAVLAARSGSLRSHLLIAPHHGSSTSSGAVFVAATQPDYVVYTTAFLNRWGFPKAAVLERWRNSGSCGLNLPVTGALRFTWQEGGGLQLSTAHKNHWTRPWAIRPLSDDYCL